MRLAAQDWHARAVRALPGQLLRPLGLLPQVVTGQGFAALCNQMFAAALAAGELAFLEGQVLCIRVDDAGIELALSCDGARLHRPLRATAPDVRIRGRAYDLLLLVSRHEDADSLFFQRRLRLEGDTELGLHLKNFLDAWEAPAQVQRLQRLAEAVLARIER